MTVELNTSAVYANKAREAQYFQLEEEQTSVVGLSLAEKETFSLARKAESGDSLWDKVVLNLVHPPALMLFALLDSGRKVVAPPLPQVQEAYDTIASTANAAEEKSAQNAPTVTQDTKTAAESATDNTVAAPSMPSQTPAPSQSTATNSTATAIRA